MNQNKQILPLHTVLASNSVIITKEAEKQLNIHLNKSDTDIVVAERLIRRWSNGEVKKSITFEHIDGVITSKMFPAPIEPGPFLKERWNPLNGYGLVKNNVLNTVPVATQNNPDKLLKHCLKNKIKITVVKNCTATEQLSLSLKDLFHIKNIIRVNKNIRDFAVFVFTLVGNVKALITTSAERVSYYRQINYIKKRKKIVLDIKFGGLGDTLVYTSLPRLLKEQYDVDFYLSNESKTIFRDKNTAKLCFELNPFFRGYAKKDDTTFTYKNFVQDKTIKTFFTDKADKNIVQILERQFDLKGQGLPEIFYKPKVLTGYKNTMLCDLNWFSGQRWGLYNDPNLIDEEIRTWLSTDANNKIEYCKPNTHDIFTYVDKIHSSKKFLTFFSGGNVIATTLETPTTVIVPENLEGTSISAFLFTNSSTKYKRKLSLELYF
jgi:hypothetical protein